MKILLINPPVFNILDPSLPQVLHEEEDPMPPLGLMYLAAYLKENTSHRVGILDCHVEKLDYAQIKEKIKQENPDVVGITTMTFTLMNVIKTIKAIKQVNPAVKIVLGGPHPTIYPKETAKINEVDFCIMGEGEKVFLKLIENINNPSKLEKIKGMAFRKGKEIINTGQTEFIENLDDLPFPARNLLPYKKYFSSVSSNFPVTTMFTSRGCPYKCLFCDRPHLGKIFRARSAKNVVDEMEECQKMGIKEIFIYDDTFTVNKQRVLDVCAEIKKRNLKINWDIRARVDTVDKETLKAMKETGCQRIHYGVEAGTQKILNVLRKGITLEQAEKAFRITKKIGIQTLGFFMLGSPQETKEDILQTIKFAKKLKPDFAVFSVTTPYPATDLYRMGLEQKVLPYDYWKEFAENPNLDFKPQFWEKELSREELLSLFTKAYRSFYFRPNYIFKRILRVRSAKEFLLKIKAALNILKI